MFTVSGSQLPLFHLATVAQRGIASARQWIFAYFDGLGGQDSINADNNAWPFIQKTDSTRILLKDEEPDEQTVCNLNTKCTDMELTGECGLPVIMRTWTVTNWCDAKTSVVDTVQWIKVVDTERQY